MKKVLICICLVLMGMVLLTGCGGAADQGTKSSTADDLQVIKDRGVVRIGVKVDVPKFGYKNPETGKVEGFEIDIAKALAKKIIGDENKVEMQGVTGKTRGALLDNGDIDYVVATATVTDERKKSYNFSDTYYTDGIGFLVKKDTGIKTFKDLDGKKIGVTQGTTTRKDLQQEAEKQGIKLSFLEFSAFPEVLSALMAGRVDCFSVDGAILAGFVDDSTVLLDERYSPQNYGVMSKKSNTALAKLISETISEMKSSGEIDKLQNKWGLK